MTHDVEKFKTKSDHSDKVTEEPAAILFQLFQRILKGIENRE